MWRVSKLPKKLPKKLSFSAVLRGLSRSNLKLESLPESIQRVTLQYARTHNLTSDLAGRFAGDVVAAALLDVWDRKVRAQLVQQHPFDSRQWITALIPVAQYITPVIWPDVEQSLLEDNVRDVARRQLVNEEWMIRIVRDHEIAQKIVKVTKGEYLDTSASQGERETLKPTSRTYHRWQKDGIKILETAVSLALKEPASRGKSEWELPDHFVPREQALDELWEAVLETVETGGWVVVVGMPGTGKRTLLAALAQDPRTRTKFPDGVAIEEVTVEIDAQALAMRLAASLGKPLSYGIQNAKDAQSELGEQLSGLRALLVVANVPSLDVLAGLPALGPGIVGVISVRSLNTAYGMGTDVRQVHLGGLTDAEGWSLAQKVSKSSGLNSSQAATAHRVLELLERHPNAVRVAAVRAAADGWERVEDAIRDARARLMELGDAREEQLNVWASLEAWWGEERQLGERLATIGCLPLLSWYDDHAGAAVWGASKVEAGVIWRQLARMQLVETIDGVRGEYRMHWLTWDFARLKAQELPWRKRMFVRWWVWRYPLRTEWAGWWKVKVTRPQGLTWPWWSPLLPATQEKRLASLWWWLTNRAWPDGLRMGAGPEEWAMVARTRSKFWAALIVAANVAIAGALVMGRATSTRALSYNQSMWWIRGWCVALGLCMWAAAVALEDFRRMTWRRLERTRLYPFESY